MNEESEPRTAAREPRAATGGSRLRTTRRALLAPALVAIGWVLLAGTSNQASPVSGASLDRGRPHGPEASGDTVVVTMTNSLKFTPDSIRIREGQTVLWKNTSALIHTVTADPELAALEESVHLPESVEPWNSGELKPGGTFSRTFRVAGTHGYFCVPHEAAGMTGTVVVEPTHHEPATAIESAGEPVSAGTGKGNPRR